MKLILFTILIIFSIKANGDSSDSDDDDDNGGFLSLFDQTSDLCPCWRHYIQDILGVCSISAAGPLDTGTDDDILCDIAGDSILFGVPIVSCGGSENPFLRPLFVDVRFGDAPFGICLSAPEGIFDIIQIIINLIKKLADIFDEVCGDDDRRRLAQSTESQAAFDYMLELMEFTPTATEGAEGRAERNRLTGMIFKEGGLAEITMQMVRESQKLKNARKKSKKHSHHNHKKKKGGRRLLDSDEDDDDENDGPDICPFGFLQFLNGGEFDPDDNPFEFILDELENVVDDVDCDNIDQRLARPVKCAIKIALNGGDDDGDDDDDENGGNSGQTLPEPKLFITSPEQRVSCREGLRQAATLLDECVVSGGCGGDDPCEIPDPNDCALA